MRESTIHQVQRLAEQLSPPEQAQLLTYLAHRLAQVATAPPPPTSDNPSETATAWEDLFRLGDTLAALDSPTSDTLTAAVLAMRR